MGKLDPLYDVGGSERLPEQVGWLLWWVVSSQTDRKQAADAVFECACSAHAVAIHDPHVLVRRGASRAQGQLGARCVSTCADEYFPT